jgi:hypothetical protein
MGVTTDLAVEIDQVPDHGGDQFPDSLYDPAVHESGARGVDQLQTQPPVDLLDLDPEILVLLDQCLGVVALVSAVEYRQCTTAHHIGQVAPAGVVQSLHFVAAQRVQHARGVQACGYGFGRQYFLLMVTGGLA